MIGGIVIDVFDKNDMLYVTVKSMKYTDKCQVRLITNEDIQIGDFIWWQARTAYWTPADEKFKDKKIKIYSNVYSLK